MLREKMMDLIVINAWKTRRTLRRLLPAALSEFKLDVFGRGRLFDAAVAIAVAYIGLKTASFPEFVAATTDWLIFVQAFFYVGAAWFLLCLLRAPFSVIKADRAVGKWHGHRRIYHERQLIAVERITHDDGQTRILKLSFADAEPHSFVKLKFDCDPDVSSRMLLFAHGGKPRGDVVLIRPNPPNLFTGFFGPKTEVSIRIDKARQASLYVRLDPNTVPTVLRVYCSHFHIGKDDDAVR